MTLRPCRLCGSAPVVQVSGYNVCCNHLIQYHVICSFYGNESRNYPSLSEAIDYWNEMNGQVRRCALSKDWTRLFDGQVFTLSEDTGKALKEWLDTGIDAPIVNNTPAYPADKRRLYDAYLKLFSDDPQNAPARAQEAMTSITIGKGSMVWTVDDIRRLEADIRGRLTETENEELQQAV